MVIREADTLADYAGILAIDEVVWNDTNAPVAMQKWTDAGEFQAAMVAEGRRHGVAVDENDVVLGYVEFSSRFPSHQYKWDIGLGVAPAAQGQGVGGQLLAWLQELARQEKMHKITLRVLGTNPKAMHLYERAGFKQVGELKDEFYLDGRFVDDYLMDWFVD
ncbi:GNAT family N-acetyltransferase [Weissella confusa]|uniref:GNAT family N-acetyltransferase n=1 Tax=Weissella confusa TaxID=1583 RepID=UPI0021A5DBAE|nr:GNAT family N-acetyltransferase [Weissella confusa]MCT2910949.1 GNAT family N-acetyltransferase [Weissella confusa]